MSRKAPFPTTNLSSLPRPPPPQINRTLFQEKTVDQSIIGKLFLLCIEGKVSAIKDFIIQNGLTVNDMVDTSGDSILHKILQNENLSKRDKIELFRFLKEKNLLKMSYNTNQSTPLHLAVKAQIPEIVKILLEAGHNPNNLDMNNKTPLFYAVSGETVECPKKNKKELSEKTKFKLEKSDSYLIIKELIKIINSKPEILNLFTHIGNTAATLDTIFSSDVNSVFEKDNKKVIDILTSNDSEEVKINKIFNAVNETKMSIAKLLLNNKLESALKPNTFQSNTQGGWGPDNNPKNKIMKVNFDFKRTFVLNLRSKITKSLSQLDNNSSNLITKMKIIDDLYIKSIDDLLNNLNYQYQILHRYTMLGLPNITLTTTILPITDKSISDKFISEDNIGGKIEVFDSREIGGKTRFNLNRDLRVDYDISGNPNPVLIPSTELALNTTHSHPYKYGKLDEKLDKANKERNVVRDMLNDINLKNTNLNNSITTVQLGEINNSKFYTRKLKMIMIEINKLLVSLDINKKIIDQEFNKPFDSIDFNIIFDSTVQIQYILLSVTNYLLLLDMEINKINTKNLELKDFLESCTQLVANATITTTTVPPKIHKIDLYFKEFQLNLDSILQNFDQIKIKQSIDDTYVLLNETYNSINTTVDIINESCSIKYINKYFNDFTSYDDFFKNTKSGVINTKTSKIENMFERNVARFNSLPSKYDDLLKILTPDNRQNNKIFIEQYLYQIHQNSYFSYYNSTMPVLQLPTIGFLYNPSLNLLLATQPNLPNLTYGDISPFPTLLDNALRDLQGSYGLKVPFEQNKSDAVIPIIGSNLSEHIKIIKQYILRYILQLTYDLLIAKINKTPLIDPKNISYADLIFGLYDKTKTILGLDVNDKSVILIIIGTCVDKLLNSNIESLIVSGINRFAYKTNRNPEFDTILNLLKNLKVNLKLLLGSDKFDIEHYMRDNTFLVEDTTKIVSSLIKESTSSNSEYIYSYAEDIFNKKSIETNEKNIKKHYSQNIMDNDPPTCYTINYAIINLLLEFRADVSIKDKEGSTVIFTALDMNDPDIINKFITLLPVYNKHSKNLFGVRPYDRALEQLNYFSSMFMDKKIISDLIEISQNIILKKTQIQSEMRYHRELYMMINTILNHYFYSMGKQYINGWSHTEQKELDEMLNMGKLDFPLLRTLGRLKSTDKDLYLQNVIGDNINTNLQLKLKAEEIQKQIVNLNLEKNDPTTKKTRSKIIDETINNLQTEIKKIDVSGVDADNKLFEKRRKELNIALKVNIDTIKKNIKKLQMKSDIISMYESIQSNIINNGTVTMNDDLKTYMLLWKESIKNNDTDSIMIIENLSKYISKYNPLENLPNLTILQSYLD